MASSRTSFVGRSEELAQIASALERGARLVTLHGPPGVGKSRLAREHAVSVKVAVRMVDLADARSREDVMTAAARALACSPDDVGDRLAALGASVVIFDDAEHAAPHAATTLGAWLDRASKAKFIVTSRERMQLEGEECIEVSPLVGDAAVELFVARARLARASFTLSDADRPAAMEVVRRLDGIPLAIELAAARAGVLSLRAMLDGLSTRFDLLRSARRDARDRQATLERAIDWSWELLDERERDALARSSVFRGGFALAEARAVLAQGDTVDLLQALVDKSLVRSFEALGDLRFALYESIREYAQRKLAARAECEELHARAYAELASSGLDDADRFDVERENLFAAHAFLAKSDAVAAARLLLDVEPFVQMRGPLAPYAARVEAALEGLGPSPTRAALLTALGKTRRLAGRAEEARALLDEALALARGADDRARVADALSALGAALQALGLADEARAALSEAIDLAQAVGAGEIEREARRHLDAKGAVDASTELFDEAAFLERQGGDLEAARRACERALTALRRAGNRRNEAIVLTRLAWVLAQLGDHEAALARVTEALALHRDVGASLFEGVALSARGHAELGLGRPEDARASFESALAIARDLKSDFVERDARRGLAQLEPKPADDPAQRVLRVAHQGMWFDLDGGGQVDLSRRKSLRLLLWALVERAGAPMPLDALVAAAWPGERILASAGAARVYTAVRTLRDLGLRDVITTGEDGYRISADVRVVRVRA